MVVVGRVVGHGEYMTVCRSESRCSSMDRVYRLERFRKE